MTTQKHLVSARDDDMTPDQIIEQYKLLFLTANGKECRVEYKRGWYSIEHVNEPGLPSKMRRSKILQAMNRLRNRINYSEHYERIFDKNCVEGPSLFLRYDRELFKQIQSAMPESMARRWEALEASSIHSTQLFLDRLGRNGMGEMYEIIYNIARGNNFEVTEAIKHARELVDRIES